MKQGKGWQSFVREHTGHSKQHFPTTQHWLYTWTSPNGQYQSQIDYILCSRRWRSCIQSAKIRPGADCGSDHELIASKFKLIFKKVRKTFTRPFRYHLNHIPYDYTVEVMNRVKGLNLVDRVTEELWTEVCNIVQEAVTKTIPKEKQKQWRRQCGCLRRLYKQLKKEEKQKAREKGENILNWMQSSRE